MLLCCCRRCCCCAVVSCVLPPAQPLRMRSLIVFVQFGSTWWGGVCAGAQPTRRRLATESGLKAHHHKRARTRFLVLRPLPPVCVCECAAPLAWSNQRDDSMTHARAEVKEQPGALEGHLAISPSCQHPLSLSLSFCPLLFPFAPCLRILIDATQQASRVRHRKRNS